MHFNVLDKVSTLLHKKLSLYLKKLWNLLFRSLLFFHASTRPVRWWLLCCFYCTPRFDCEGTRDDHHECWYRQQAGAGRRAPRRACRHGGDHDHGPQPLDPSERLQVRSPEDHRLLQGLRQKDVPSGEGPYRPAAHHWDQTSVHHGCWCEQAGATEMILRAGAARVYYLVLYFFAGLCPAQSIQDE